MLVCFSFFEMLVTFLTQESRELRDRAKGKQDGRETRGKTNMNQDFTNYETKKKC